MRRKVSMKPVIGTLLLLPAIALAGSASLAFVPPGQYGGLSAQRVVALPNGNKLIAGWQNAPASFESREYVEFPFNPTPNRHQATLAFLDASGHATEPSFVLGTGNDLIADAAVDQFGNIWLAGNTDSDDFPLVHPLVSTKEGYVSSGFLVELDPTGSTILFSTLLGGASAGTTVNAMALDPAGNVYVTGSTSDATFPSTVPVFGGSNQSVSDYAFVVKVSGADRTMVYSAKIGGSGASCFVTIPCPSNTASSISVDSTGTVTIAGLTNGGIPTTPNAFQTTCACGQGGPLASAGFITRIAPDARSLIWSTYIHGTGAAFGFVNAIAVDSSGNVFASGVTSPGFPVTPDAIQSVYTAPVLPGSPFIAELSSDGSTLIYGTYLGGSSHVMLSGVGIDSQDNLWITGSTTSPELPVLPNTPALGNDFALELNAAGTALQQSYRLPTGVVTQPPVFDQNGNLLLLSANGSLLTLNPVGPFPSPSLLSVDNAGALVADGGVSPGELVTVFGVTIGPTPPQKSEADANGSYPTTLGGLQVLFGNTPAPLIYAGANQIELQVPSGLTPGTTMSVITPSGTIGPFPIALKTSLGIFQTSPGIALALNEDMTVNSPSNPAQNGSIVAFYVTGVATATQGMNSRGASSLDVAKLGIEVINGNLPGSAPITYLGPAPGIIDGVSQLNVQVFASNNDAGAILTLNLVGQSPAYSNSVLVYLH